MKGEPVHERCLDRRKFIAGAAGVSVAVVAAALTSCAPEHDATEEGASDPEDEPANAAPDGAALIERMESRNGAHTLEHAEAIGLGSQAYELVNIDV